MEKKEYKQLARVLTDVILKNVSITKNRGRQGSLFEEPNGLKEKIDLVDRTLEILRIENRYLENKLNIEDVIQGSIKIKGNILHYTEPEKQKNMGSGISPLRLQPKLLLFLLYRHIQKDIQVYDISWSSRDHMSCVSTFDKSGGAAVILQ